jgi:hypothetical protein
MWPLQQRLDEQAPNRSETNPRSSYSRQIHQPDIGTSKDISGMVCDVRNLCGVFLSQ